MILSWGKGSPITPVDAVKTRFASIPNNADTPSQSAVTDPSPRLPVKAFELPEFTMIAAAPLVIVPSFA